MSRPLPPVAELAARYAAGATLRDLARATGTSLWRVRTALLAADVPLRGKGGRPRPATQVADWAAARRAGQTYGQIAAQAGVHTSTVHYALQRAGLAPRQRRRSPAYHAWPPRYAHSRPPATAPERAFARLFLSLPAGADVSRVLAALAAESDWVAAAADLARAARAVRT